MKDYRQFFADERIDSKPETWGEVRSRICYSDASPEQQQALREMEVIDFNRIEGPSLNSPKVKGAKNQFIARVEGHEYYVNTEGYDYCKYVSRVCCIPATPKWRVELDVLDGEETAHAYAELFALDSWKLMGVAPNGSGAQSCEFTGNKENIALVILYHEDPDSMTFTPNVHETLMGMPLSFPPTDCETCGAKTVGEHLKSDCPFQLTLDEVLDETLNSAEAEVIS